MVEAGVEDGVAQERPTNLHQPRKFELKYVPITYIHVFTDPKFSRKRLSFWGTGLFDQNVSNICIS